MVGNSKMSFDVLKFEHTCTDKLKNIKVDGLEIWPVLRILCYSSNSIEGKKKFLFKFFLKNLFYAFLFFRGRKNTLFFCESRESNLFRPYLEVPKIGKFQYFERPSLYCPSINTNKAPNFTSTLLLDILAYLLAFIIKKRIFDPNKILKELKDEYNVEINLHKIRVLFAYEKIFLLLFRLIRPERIILSTHYNVSHFAVTLAAKKLNIKVIEIQHGILNEYHPAYSTRARFFMNSLFYPDEVFLFGRIFYENISDTAVINKERFKIVGSSLIKPIDRDSDADHSLKILVILQDDHEHKIIPWIKEIINIMPNMFFYILPRTWKEDKYNELKKWDFSNFKMYKEENFYKFISKVAVHVTYNSTTALEAAYLGVPTILLCYDQKPEEYFRGFSKYLGQAIQCAYSPKEAAEKIDSLVKKPLNLKVNNPFIFENEPTLRIQELLSA